jgi:phage tail-like protein
MATARKVLKSHWVVAAVVAVLAIVASDRLISLSTQPELPRYSFVVNIEGKMLSAFREVTGLDVEIEVVEFSEGTGGVHKKLPGMTKYSNIVLKRGFTGDTQLYKWFTEFSEEPTERWAGEIVMTDQKHNEVARWNFVNAWPTKVTGPQLNRNSNDVPIESIELVHEGLTRATPSTPPR